MISNNGDLLCEAHYLSQQPRCAECDATIGQEEHQVTAWAMPGTPLILCIYFIPPGFKIFPKPGMVCKGIY